MSIKQLPGDVVAQIKSSIVITSLNNVICGLLRNSLDAEATRVNICADYCRGSCSVEDDGVGIPPAEFLPDGGLGKLHFTSRYPPRPGCHGKHGTFLASVAALSLLSVVSRHSSHKSHNALRIHNSAVLTRDMPAPPEQRIASFPHGTRVTVRDLFGSMPVRVKQRPPDADRAASSKEWDRLVHSLTALLLAWPGDVLVSLRDPAGRQIFRLRTTESLGKRETGHRQARQQDRVARTARLLSHASLCDINDIESWVPVGVSAPGFSIDGCVSSTPAATKQIQFISIGVEPLSDEYHSNVLYEEINKIFSNSSFGTIEEPSRGQPEQRDNPFTGRELKTRKGVDRWPMFYVNIHLESRNTSPLAEVDDVLDERRQNLAVILDMLRAMFHQFLKKHYFLSRTAKLSYSTFQLDRGKSKSRGEALATIAREQNSASPSQRARVGVGAGPALTYRDRRQQSIGQQSRSQSPFASWAIVKPPGLSGDGLKVGASRTDNETAQLIERSEPLRITPTPTGEACAFVLAPPEAHATRESGKVLRHPFDNLVPAVDEETQRAASCIPPGEGGPAPAEPETLSWVNPYTGKKCVIDARTGFVVSRRPPAREDVQQTPGADRLESEQRLTLTPKKPAKEASPWLRDILAQWRNPVFETAEPSIPHLPDVAGDNVGSCGTSGTGNEDNQMASEMQGRISKETLRNCEVIGQVDQKFILTKVPATDAREESQYGEEGRKLLVLVDQHAADERCQVEALMDDYFASEAGGGGVQIWRARSIFLDKPLQFDLPLRERPLLERYRAYFEHWGIWYEVASDVNEGARQKRQSTVKLQVLRLPPSIAERCRLDPKLLVDIIRREIWKLNDTGREATPTAGVVTGDSEEPEHAWVPRFHGCPQGIIDLLNARACRSAIMFNDPLSLEECSALLARVTRCAFPFQCAHGRPSMVPLLDVGSGLSSVEGWAPSGGVEREGDGTFLAKFREWQGGEGH